MARYTGPTTRLSRRFNQHILGSGKALERRNYPPVQHGPRMRRNPADNAAEKDDTEGDD